MAKLARIVNIKHNRTYSLVTLAEEVRAGSGIFARILEQHTFSDPGVINSSLAEFQARNKALELRAANGCK
jgi:hypothetical protein